jgi:hypothetical protein
VRERRGKRIGVKEGYQGKREGVGRDNSGVGEIEGVRMEDVRGESEGGGCERESEGGGCERGE